MSLENNTNTIGAFELITKKADERKQNLGATRQVILRNSRELSYMDSVDVTRVKSIKDAFIACKQHFCYVLSRRRQGRR